MSATAVLDRLGRPGDIRLGTARPAAMPRLPTGLPPLDTVLDGGLPRGRLTELAGARSTGRTALACAIAGAATRAGETIAWVDPEDGLEPETAADAGVLLAHVLWVRPRGERDALRAAELLLGAGGCGCPSTHSWRRRTLHDGQRRLDRTRDSRQAQSLWRRE